MNRAAVIAAICGGCVSVAGAQVIDWAAAVSGNWNNAANWSPANVPDTAAETARFQVNGTYTATVNGTFSIASLQQTITNVTIDIPGGSNLFVNGPTYNNRGLVRINPTNAGVETRLRFDANTNITGNGITRLGGVVNRSIVESVGAITVTNGPNHTFDGMGQFRSVITNNGTVNANVSGQGLSLQVTNKTNNALFTATGGGVLSIDGIGITQGAAGLISANGGTVNFTGSSSLSGGTVNGISPSLVQISGTSTWNGVTALGSVNILGGSNIFVGSGGLVVDGSLVINPSNAGAETRLRYDAPANLAGSGEVVLSGSTNRSIVDAIDAAAIITIGPAIEVHGLGQIRAPMVNNGTVTADVNGNTLTCMSHPKSNGSLMRAIGGGFLDFNIGMSQSAAGEVRADGGTVRFFSGSSLTGGNLTSMNSGLVQISGSVPFSGVTNASVLDINGGSSLGITNSLVNNGTVTINPSNAGAETRLQFNDTSDLSGSGVVVLSGFDNRAVFDTAPGSVVTVGPNQEVRGFGQVRAELINNGVMRADVSGQLLRLHSSNKTNNNDILAQNSATLNINAITVTQNAGAFIEADGATVNLESGNVDGGEIRTINGGVFRTISGSNIVRNVTFSGDGDVNAGTNLAVTGAGLVNNGLLEINPSNAGVETRLQFNETGSLSGSGEVRLTAFSNRAIIDALGVTITNAAPHRITGFGQVRAPLINNSTISANVAGQNLELVSSAKTNNSIIEVVNDGSMTISGITVTQGAGGVIRNTQGALTITNSTISGGTVRATAPSVVSHTGTSVNSGASLFGEHQVAGGSNLGVAAGFANNGVININPSNAGVETRLRFDASAIIQGTGEIRLSGSANRSIIDCTAFMGTVGAAQRLTGIGQVRGHLHTLGHIAPGFSAGTIDCSGATMTFGTPAVIEIEVGGTGTSQFDRFTGNAAWTLHGTLEVSHINAFVPALGQRYVIIDGSSVSGSFDNFTAPDLGGIEWKVVYFPSKVELQVRCKADLSGSSDPNDPNYGIPDGVTDASDFFYYLDLFVSSDFRADLTTSSDPNDPSYGIRDGIIDASDFFFFLDLFTGACG